MNTRPHLTERQEDALARAREVLAEDPRPHQGRLTAQWHTAVRLALVDVLKAFEGGTENDHA